MVSNDNFGYRITNRPHATPNYGPIKFKFKVNYCRQKYVSPEKLAHIQKNLKNRVKK